jgi:hypothetical protein
MKRLSVNEILEEVSSREFEPNTLGRAQSDEAKSQEAGVRAVAERISKATAPSDWPAWKAPCLNLSEARAQRHREIAASHAANVGKPAPLQPTPQQLHDDLVTRRRLGNNTQFFNRKSFQTN